MDEGRLLCEKNNLPFQINLYCVKCYIELPKRYTGEQYTAYAICRNGAEIEQINDYNQG